MNKKTQITWKWLGRATALVALISPVTSYALSREEVTNSVDVNFNYTAERRDNYGGVRQTFANMRQSLGLMNRAMDSSDTGVFFSFSTHSTPTQYRASSSNNNIVTDLRNGRVQGTIGRRDRVGADVMGVNGQMRAAGVAFVGDPRQYAIKFLTGPTTAHEVGHTFGASHGGIGSGFEDGRGDRPYAAGWAFRDSNGRRYGTVMTGAQILWYSTPRNTFQGRRTGIANVKDSSRRIRETKQESSRIRSFRPEGGRAGGWYHIRNRLSNLQMGLRTRSRDTGIQLAQTSDRSTFAQWRFDNAGIGGGWLTCRNRGSDRSIDMGGISRQNRPVRQALNNRGSRNQHLKFDHDDNGMVRIRFRNGGRVIQNTGRRTNSGNPLTQLIYNNTTHTQWWLERRND